MASVIRWPPKCEQALTRPRIFETKRRVDFLSCLSRNRAELDGNGRKAILNGMGESDPRKSLIIQGYKGWREDVGIEPTWPLRQKPCRI